MNPPLHHCAGDGSSLIDVSFTRDKEDVNSGPKMTLQEFNIQISLSRGAL